MTRDELTLDLLAHARVADLRDDVATLAAVLDGTLQVEVLPLDQREPVRRLMRRRARRLPRLAKQS